MRVMGIDPGSNITGYGIVDERGGAVQHVDNGTIAPKPALPFAERLLEIHRGLTALIAAHRPDAVAVENVFCAKNARSALLLGHARGIALLAAQAAGLPIEEYAPSAIKLALTGSGRADKQQIQKMVRAILSLPEVACEDASDALAVAICHCNSARLREKVNVSCGKK
jgi:crossover junction endodeoxyribonuclease RuvC